MKRTLSLLALLAFAAVAILCLGAAFPTAPPRAVTVTADGVLATPTNFFDTNAAAIHRGLTNEGYTFGGGGGASTFTSQFGSTAAGSNIVSGVNLTNIIAHSAITLSNAAGTTSVVLSNSAADALRISGAVNVVGGVTNEALTASQLVKTDANKRLVSASAVTDAEVPNDITIDLAATAAMANGVASGLNYTNATLVWNSPGGFWRMFTNAAGSLFLTNTAAGGSYAFTDSGLFVVPSIAAASTVSVAAQPYETGDWNDNLTVPTKDDVRDKFVTVDAAVALAVTSASPPATNGLFAISTGSGRGVTFGNTLDMLNVSNLVRVSSVIAPSSAVTNFTLTSSPSRQFLRTANTNAHLAFGTLAAGQEWTVFVSALTSSVPCIVTFASSVIYNTNANLTVPAGQELPITFYAEDTSPTNCRVAIGGFFKR